MDKIILLRKGTRVFLFDVENDADARRVKYNNPEMERVFLFKLIPTSNSQRDALLEELKTFRANKNKEESMDALNKLLKKLGIQTH